MKKTHPSHYLMQLQLIMVGVLGVLMLITHANYILAILPTILAIVTVLFGAMVLNQLGRLMLGSYSSRDDYVHGASLPVRVYSPQF